MRQFNENISFAYSYDLIQPAQNSYGQKVNGSWDGLIGQLVRKVVLCKSGFYFKKKNNSIELNCLKEVDMAIGPFGVSLQRYEAMNFAGLIGGTGITLLIKFPQSESSNWTVLQPFSYPVIFFKNCIGVKFSPLEG